MQIQKRSEQGCQTFIHSGAVESEKPNCSPLFTTKFKPVLLKVEHLYQSLGVAFKLIMMQNV